MSSPDYFSIRHRLIANSEPAHEGCDACWIWTGKKRCRFGYGRFNLYVPGLQRVEQLTAHICMWLFDEVEIGALVSADDLWLAYQTFRSSGLTIDHRCVNSSCINPQHFEIETLRVNVQLRHSRKVYA